MANFFQKLFSGTEERSALDSVKTYKVNQYSGNVKNPDFDLSKPEIISTVFTCIKILSDNVNRMPLYVFQDTGNQKNQAKKHKYYNQLRYSPQPFANSKDWLSSVITSLYLKGNAYALIDKQGFTFLDPDKMQMGVVGYELWYHHDQIQVPLRASEILHFRLLTKDPFSKGLNPIESLRTELNIQWKAEKTVDNFYTNNSHSTKVLQQNLELGKSTNTKLAELVDDFQKKYAGHTNAGGLIVAPPSYEIKELKLNAGDLQFLESAKYTEATIGAMYGVPQYLLGKNDFTGKYEEASIYFRNNTLSALMNVITSELEYKLLSIAERNNGLSIEFDSNNMNAINITDKANALKSVFSMGAITPNEVSKAFGLQPTENEAMNFHYMQGATYPLELGNPFGKPTSTNDNLKQDDETK